MYEEDEVVGFDPDQKMVYVAGPYRAPTERGVVLNIRAAEAVAAALWKAGYAVVCPHMNSALLGGIMPDEAWLVGDYTILSRCDIVAMVPGWEKSSGARAEHALARQLGKTVIYPADLESAGFCHSAVAAG